MKQILTMLILASLTALAACGDSRAEADQHEHAQEVMEWREWRLEQLLKPTGYLTQVGLFWVRDGSYSIGSSKDSDIRLPATAPAIGSPNDRGCGAPDDILYLGVNVAL